MPSWPWTLILLFGWEGWSAKRCNVCHAFRTMTGSFENRDVANWTSHFGCKLKISWNLGCCFIMLDWIQCFKKCSVGIFYVVRIGSKFFSRERSRCLPGSHAWNHPATLCGTSAQLKVELSDPPKPSLSTVSGRAIGPTLWVANNGCKSESIITLPAANSLLLNKNMNSLYVVKLHLLWAKCCFGFFIESPAILSNKNWFRARKKSQTSTLF